ncbi:MAG: Asp-tRNA(Asn)/Glu-tRNA(Gln) amidotransferase subunit GatA [Terriglobia bacterium]
MDPTQLTLTEIRDLLRRRELSARELTEQHYHRIAQRDPEIGAYLCLCRERAFAQADALDHKLRAGDPLPPLAGLPVAVKDVILTRDVPTTAGSRILENYLPPYDATAVARLEQAGAILLGKANCDEFAMGSSNENSAYFPCRNPHALDRVPGGSSGGSAAAVAARLAVAALGSDTGGSIRQPAGFCGVVGMIGTYGRVSRYGLIAYASSLDHIGSFARTVRDLAAVLAVIAGHDPLDSTSADVPVPDYVAELNKPVKGMKVGVPREYFGAGLDPEVRAAVEAAIAKLGALGCELVEVSLPHTEYAIACYYIIATAEASSNLARYDGVRYAFRAPEASELDAMYQATRGGGFGTEVKRRIVLGTYALSAGYYEAYYLKAQKVRQLIYQDFRRVFEPVDALLTPTSPTPAFRLGEKTADPLQMYLADIYTVTADLAGVPGISIPCGKNRQGLPIGLQLMGRHFDEARLLRLAYACEQAGS